MFAIIKTGGKQYKVEEGSVIKVEKLAADIDSEVTFNEILMVGSADKVEVGAPFISNAVVTGTVKNQGKADKKINFKYNKKTYYRKKGHRQLFTEVQITKITL